MPIPQPKGGESQDQFVSRCISQIYDEYGQEQSAAICINQYNQNMSMTTQQKVNKKISRLGQLRGINLKPNGVPVDLIDPNPCWSGYIAIGTKIVDGREVPNCVPEN